jgi:hypothetical protein
MREADDKPGPLALSLMAASRVVDLCDNADETAALVRELLDLSNVPDHGLTRREAALALMIGHKVALAKRLLGSVLI